MYRYGVVGFVVLLFCSGVIWVKAEEEDAKKLVELGDQALKEAKYDVALNHYTKAIKKEPNDFSAIYKRASVYLSKGKPSEALDDLERVLALNPAFIQALLRRAKILMQFGRYAEASKDIEAFLIEKPNYSLALKHKEEIQQAETNLKLGKQALEKIRESLSDSSLVLSLATNAKAHFTSVIGISSDFTTARLLRAEAALYAKDHHTVLEDTIRVLKRDPTMSKGLYLRGRAFHALGEKDSAMKLLREALRFDPENKECQAELKKIKNWDTYSTEGHQRLSSNQFAKALESFNQALLIYPDIPEYTIPMLLKKCKCLVELKDAEKAIEACTQALQGNWQLNTDQEVEAYSLRAEAKIAVEEYDQAIADYHKAREKQPNNRHILQGLQNAEKLAKMAKRKDYYKVIL